MPSTKGYRSYHGKGGAGRIVLIVLLCLILLAAVGFLVLQRYAVYGSDGSIRFDLPWKQTEEPSGPSAPDGASRTPYAPDDSPNVIIDEPEPPAKPELTELRGAELSESVLRGSADAAGYDLYACPADGQSVTIAPHTTAMIGTGLALAIPAGYFGGVFARSGLASRQGLRPANCVGVIDADYRGECTVALHNDTDAPRTVAPGDRIAQLVILPFLAAEFSDADTLDETDRGAGGFGSTGR